MENKAKYGLEQVAIRMVKEPPLYSETPVTNSDDAVRLLAEALRDYDREVFGVVNFKTSGEPINMNIVSMGTLNNSIVDSKDVLKSAILSNADSILLFHNHPGGSLHPSKADIQLTDKLLLACGLMDISVLDHIIFAGGNTKEYFSFMDKEIMTIPKILYKSNIDELEFSGEVREDRTIQYVERRYRRRTDGEKQKAAEDVPGQGKNERVSVKGKLEENREKVEAEKGKGEMGKGRDMGLE